MPCAMIHLKSHGSRGCHLKHVSEVLSLYFSLGNNGIEFQKEFYIKAKKLFEEEKIQESKFLFERNIVYNPRHAKSYLYLAKIYKIEEDKAEEEKNLNTTLLLDT